MKLARRRNRRRSAMVRYNPKLPWAGIAVAGMAAAGVAVAAALAGTALLVPVAVGVGAPLLLVGAPLMVIGAPLIAGAVAVYYGTRWAFGVAS